LIDTSILIDAEKQRIDLESHLRRIGEDDISISVITASELLHGVHRARDMAVRSKRGAIVEEFIGRFTLLDVDLNVARAHSRLWADLETAGTPIGGHDTWLAATCIAHGLTIVTASTREFERVQGLVVETWK